MDRTWLETRLAEGRSIESLAREVGKAPSTVAYWVNKFGLVSAHVARHAPRGRVREDELRSLVEAGRSSREIARALDVSQATIRYWLERYGLKTQPSNYARGGDERGWLVRECREHGWTWFRYAASHRTYRCAECNAVRVKARRKRVKEILVGEAGGSCVLCGYDRYHGALQFHHLDPSAKRFQIGGRGLTRSLASLREEARGCVLLCGNCHAEVEAGISRLPLPSVAPDRG